MKQEKSMAYNLIISPEAVRDMEKAFEYYNSFSSKAVNLFSSELQQVYDVIERNPFFQIRYKNIRAIPFKSLPYLVFFELNEKTNIIFIYSIFNTYLNTDKYPEP